MSETFTVAEVALRLKVSPSTVRREIADGRLTARRMRSAIRVSSADLDAYIEALPTWQSANEGTDTRSGSDLAAVVASSARCLLAQHDGTPNTSSERSSRRKSPLWLAANRSG